MTISTYIEGAITETAEATSATVTDNAQTAINTTTRFYDFFVLPTTEKLYVITAIEWKNGITVAGNVNSAVELVDADPPTLAPTQLIAIARQIAQSGASALQKNSAIASKPVRGGTTLGVFMTSSDATATFRSQTGLTSQNQQKAVANTAVIPNQDVTAWTVNTEHLFIRAYYRGYK